ncbi:hypothetical protein [Nostoc sp.]|uniref:hypothetical protein n=1 Tax=Nostoc sp. TaxID=1180 RepID=UPI002FFB73FD
MISGNFGDEGELFFEIELIAADSFQLPVEALLDTGFSWWLAINNQEVEILEEYSQQNWTVQLKFEKGRLKNSSQTR